MFALILAGAAFMVAFIALDVARHTAERLDRHIKGLPTDLRPDGTWEEDHGCKGEDCDE